MEDRPAGPVKKSKLRKLKKAKKRLLKSSKHETFISCLTGLYSCQWHDQKHETIKPGHWCCKKGECICFSLLVLTFGSSFVFLYMWGEARNDYNSFDWYSFINLGYWFHWSTFLLFLAVFLFSYLFFLIGVTLFTLFLSMTGLTIISMFWKRQWHTFYLSFQVTAPFLHVVAIFTMVLLAWPVALHFFRVRDKVLQVLIITPYLVVLIFLIFVPLGMYSPCIREKGTLGPKPGLIGHRGAPMLAPENTEMSFVKTIDYGAVGLETDVTISYDGIPFLMHDHSLRRTTNVNKLLPHLSDEDPAYFSWGILRQLNAGQWFFKNKPFYDMPPLSPEDEEWAMNQTVFKFSDLLTLADKANKLVLFDLYRPPKYHPYRDNWVTRTIEVLQKESKIKPHLVLWLENPNRRYVQFVAPGFQHISPSVESIEDLKLRKIGKLNLDYRRLPMIDIRKYAEANITTNLWVVSEPWLYSLAWCYGVQSVTTDAVHTLGNISQPFFFLTPEKYKTIWVATDMLAIFFIPLLFIIRWWKQKKKLRRAARNPKNIEKHTLAPLQTGPRRGSRRSVGPENVGTTSNELQKMPAVNT